MKDCLADDTADKLNEILEEIRKISKSTGSLLPNEDGGFEIAFVVRNAPEGYSASGSITFPFMYIDRIMCKTSGGSISASYSKLSSTSSSAISLSQNAVTTIEGICRLVIGGNPLSYSSYQASAHCTLVLYF